MSATAAMNTKLAQDLRTLHGALALGFQPSKQGLARLLDAAEAIERSADSSRPRPTAAVLRLVPPTRDEVQP